jgi:hypothetical protein
MIHTLIARGDYAVPKIEVDKLIELSGGHPGLIQILLEGLVQHGSTYLELDKSDIEAANDIGLSSQCKTIFESLTTSEKNTLIKYILRPSEAEKRHLSELTLKGILVEEKNETFKIFSPIFENYLLLPNKELALRVDIQSKDIYFGTEEITRLLTPNEHKLLVLFDENQNSVLSKDDIARALWPMEKDHSTNDLRVQKTIDRLRRKLASFSPRLKGSIKTLRGRGYRFARGD